MRAAAIGRFETVKVPAPTAYKEAAMGVEHVAIGEGGLRLQGVEILATMAAEKVVLLTLNGLGVFLPEGSS
jgi:hypothetical protein